MLIILFIKQNESISILKPSELTSGIFSIFFLFPFLNLPKVTCGVNRLSLSKPSFFTVLSINSANFCEFSSFSVSSRKTTFGNFWLGKNPIPFVSKIILLKPKSYFSASSMRVCTVLSSMLPRNLSVR